MDKTNLENEYIFRPEPWLRIVAIFAFLFGGFVFMLPEIFIILTTFFQNSQSDSFALLIIQMLFISLPFCGMEIFFLGIMGTLIYSLFHSYIKTSPIGIEFNYWPLVHIRIQWEDIDHSRKYYIMRQPIYFKRFEKLGRALSYPGIFMKLQIGSGSIVIRHIYGNPKTSIDMEMKKYLPNLPLKPA